MAHSFGENARLEALGLRPGPLRVERLQLWPGEIVGVSGPSGSGKTLLLRSLADLDPHGGSLRLDGVDSRSLAPATWRREVCYVAAESAWWSDRVADHFRRWPAEAAAFLGLEDGVASWAVSRLSTGEKQRLALLRSLAPTPKVLLLDEPTSALDATNARRVEDLIRRWVEREDTAVLWVAHDPQQLDRLCRHRWETGSGELRLREAT